MAANHLFENHHPKLGGVPYARNMMQARLPSLWQGLAGFWAPFMGATGLVLKDYSMGRNDMDFSGMGTDSWGGLDATGGLKNNTMVLDFDGGNDLCKTGDVLEVGVPISIAALMFFDSIDDNRTTVMARREGTERAFHFRINNTGGRPSLLTTSGGASTSTTLAVSTGEWVMVGCKLDLAGDVTFYVNEANQFIADNLTITSTNGDFVSIGAHSATPDDFHDGRYAWAGLWDRELTDWEFMQLFKGITPLHKYDQVLAKATVAAGVTIPIMDHHYRQMRYA